MLFMWDWRCDTTAGFAYFINSVVWIRFVSGGFGCIEFVCLAYVCFWCSGVCGLFVMADSLNFCFGWFDFTLVLVLLFGLMFVVVLLLVVFVVF